MNYDNEYLKKCVKGMVHFDFYRNGQLWYRCENGFAFPVPISDLGDASCNREEKGILLMRYIRKWLEELKNV